LLGLRIDPTAWSRTSTRDARLLPLDGQQIGVALTRLTRNDMAIETNAGEKRFTRDTVHGVAVRGHALRKSALIGAGMLAVLGAVTVCSDEGVGNCVTRRRRRPGQPTMVTATVRVTRFAHSAPPAVLGAPSDGTGARPGNSIRPRNRTCATTRPADPESGARQAGSFLCGSASVGVTRLVT